MMAAVMPRVLARLPYGAATKPIDEFGYEEAPADDAGNPKPMDHDSYCWMNAAYVMGVRMTAAFAESGFCTAIRGAENGGKVDNLPMHTFMSDDGDVDGKCPTEIGITDRREAELSKLGFLPLVHYKNTDYAVFFGAQTTQKPKVYDRPDANENAKISARLPYLMATSRFTHYLKVMARDKIGGFMEADECERWLNRWISNYVNNNEGAGAELKARYGITYFSIGGGMGIIYRDALSSGEQAWWDSQPADKRPLTPESYGAALVPRLQPLGLKILLEHGRFMVGNAGVLLARVEHLKRGAGQNFLIVDVAMNDLVRPAMYDSFHEIVPVHRDSSRRAL